MKTLYYYNKMQITWPVFHNITYQITGEFLVFSSLNPIIAEFQTIRLPLSGCRYRWPAGVILQTSRG